MKLFVLQLKTNLFILITFFKYNALWNNRVELTAGF